MTVSFRTGHLPVFPGGGRLRLRVALLVLGQFIQVVLKGIGPVRLPGLRQPCGVLNRYALPALGEDTLKTGLSKLGGQGFGAEMRHVLLHQRQIDSSQGIQFGEFARIAKPERDMMDRHG